nr:C25 family cysteine peptidase [uncultured Muribaculum sp.]
MFYDRQTSEADAPKYLLLFGDGSFDNRKLTSAWKSVDMSNMLLTYQTEESLNKFSYVIDDYFGFLDDMLLTLLPQDIAGWGRSIQLRGIELPPAVREELLMIVAEARHDAVNPN